MERNCFKPREYVICSDFFTSDYRNNSFYDYIPPIPERFLNSLTKNNSLVGKNKFELDYWGLSYKQAFEYILTHDYGKNITIFSPTSMAKINTNILTPSDRGRINLVPEINTAKYFVGNYRWHFEQKINNDELRAVFYNLNNEKWYSLKMKTSDLLYSIENDNVKIIAIYKLDQAKILHIK